MRLKMVPLPPHLLPRGYDVVDSIVTGPGSFTTRHWPGLLYESLGELRNHLTEGEQRGLDEELLSGPTQDQDQNTIVACLIRSQGTDPRTFTAFDGGRTPMSLFLGSRAFPVIFLRQQGATHEQNLNSQEYIDYELWESCHGAINDVIAATHTGRISKNSPIYDHIIGLRLAMTVATRVHESPQIVTNSSRGIIADNHDDEQSLALSNIAPRSLIPEFEAAGVHDHNSVQDNNDDAVEAETYIDGTRRCGLETPMGTHRSSSLHPRRRRGKRERMKLIKSAGSRLVLNKNVQVSGGRNTRTCILDAVLSIVPQDDKRDSIRDALLASMPVHGDTSISTMNDVLANFQWQIVPAGNYNQGRGGLAYKLLQERRCMLLIYARLITHSGEDAMHVVGWDGNTIHDWPMKMEVNNLRDRINERSCREVFSKLWREFADWRIHYVYMLAPLPAGKCIPSWSVSGKVYIPSKCSGKEAWKLRRKQERRKERRRKQKANKMRGRLNGAN